jgi:hypothetical protein
MLFLVNDSVYFEIVIRALSESLTVLDFPHRIVNAPDLNDTKNVYLLCTVHEGKSLPKNYIAYQFEQLCSDKIWPEEFWNRLRKARAVWDYSALNVRELQRRGILVLHVPLGYSKCMQCPNVYSNDNNKKYDFVFLGAMNESRVQKFTPLYKVYRSKPEKVFINNSVWGDDIYKLYKCSKIGINMHFYGGKQILEVHRIIPMIANRLWVISEHGDDPWYEDTFKDLVTWYTNPVDLARKGLQVLLQDPVKFENEIEKRYTHLVKNCSMLGYISRPDVLESLKNTLPCLTVGTTVIA